MATTDRLVNLDILLPNEKFIRTQVLHEGHVCPNMRIETNKIY